MTDLLIAAVLVSQLGSPSFTVRQRADAALVVMGERALPALQLHASSRDPEVRLRVGRLIGFALPGQIDAMFARHQWAAGTPYADALPIQHPRHATVYHDYYFDPRVQARAALEPANDYPVWRAVTRVWLIDEVYGGGLTLGEAEAILTAMCARCPAWVPNKGWVDLEADP